MKAIGFILSDKKNHQTDQENLY